MINDVQCAVCTRFKRKDFKGNFCEAFPDGDGIPTEIIQGKHDHRLAYPGDNGVRFKRRDSSTRREVGRTV